MVVRENKGMIIHPSYPIRRLNQLVPIRPHMPHRLTPRLRLKQLNRRIRSNDLRIQRFSSHGIQRRAMIDQQQSQDVGVRICTHVKTVQVERPVAVDAWEVLGSHPFDAVFKPPRAAGVEDDDTVEEAAT